MGATTRVGLSSPLNISSPFCHLDRSCYGKRCTTDAMTARKLRYMESQQAWNGKGTLLCCRTFLYLLANLSQTNTMVLPFLILTFHPEPSSFDQKSHSTELHPHPTLLYIGSYIRERIQFDDRMVVAMRQSSDHVIAKEATRCMISNEVGSRDGLCRLRATRGGWRLSETVHKRRQRGGRGLVNWL